jgi:hypothetical protein
MTLRDTPAASGHQTQRRGRWVWLALLAFGGCGLPTYGDFAQSRPVAPLQDAGTDAADATADACADGGCGSPTCAPGTGDCNGNVGDGCETQLNSTEHCGGCGVACTNDHGTTACVADADAGADCTPVCAAGFADCDLNPSNGCETNLNTDSTHCGGCGLACPANGGTPLCTAGKCGVSSCNSGFGDCKNIGSCDVDLNTDANNCGHCGHVCSSSHGTPSCNGGTCQITCDSGYGDCNEAGVDGGAPPDDGCETKLNVLDSGGSVPNCGACGAACARRGFTTINVAQCALGVCARDCFTGQADCDNNRDNPACNGSNCGCETTLGNNANDCGACGHVCKGGACTNSACECPDAEPKSGSTSCTLAGTVQCGLYGTSCTCTCTSGVFECTDANGKAC